MVRLKHIVAYFLLLVYGIAFGHQLIPHHHHTIDENNHHHHHADHHDHDEAEHHHHVAHENHFDEGIIDYIGCILGNHEHNPATECEFVQAPNDQKRQQKKNGTAANKENSCEVPAFTEAGISDFYDHLEYHQDGVYLSSGKRGPPLA